MDFTSTKFNIILSQSFVWRMEWLTCVQNLNEKVEANFATKFIHSLYEVRTFFELVSADMKLCEASDLKPLPKIQVR